MAAIDHPERHPDDLPPVPHGRRGIPRGLLWALALAVVVLTIASWVAFSSEQPATGPNGEVVRLGNGNAPPALGTPAADLVGRVAPDTTFTTFTGERTRLADLRGRPVVVNFWGSYCTPCITEMPDLERLHERYGDRVTFVGLAVQDTDARARDMAAKTGVTYALGFDPAGDIARAYGTVNLPSTYLVDADGTVKAQWPAGAVPMDKLAAAIDPLLA